MEGLIPSQLGFAARVRPQGAIQASWEAFLKEQIERDEAIRYAATPDAAPLALSEPKEKRSIIKWLRELVP